MNKETQISTRLEQLESVIQRNLETIVSSQFEAGAALIEIRDQRLYLESFKTFEAYCQERWDMSRRHADRLIEAAGISNNVRPVGLIQPKKERQVRPLAGLNPSEQRNIWKEAVKDANGKEPTQSQVEVAKAVVLNRSLPTIEQNTANTLNEDIKVGIYRVFEESNKQTKKFKTRPEQRRFKAKLLEFLSKHLIPDFVNVCAVPPLPPEKAKKL